jgi:predicted nuclease with TOPRIM domain
MAEDNKIQEVETLNAELKAQVESLTSEKETISSELAELKGMDYKKMYEELKAKTDKKSDSKEDDKTEMKSLVTEVSNIKEKIISLEKENTELKSFVNEPQLKALIEAKSKPPETKETTKPVSMWDVC